MYWEKSGAINTGATIEAALGRAGELKISNIVVASTSGETAGKVADLGKGVKITWVTHHVGAAGPGIDGAPASARAALKERGVEVLTTTHLLAGVDRALRLKFQGIYPPEIIASTLRMLSQGVKVCVEISVMALDAGLIPYGEEIVAIGGSSRGADTSCVILPAHSNNFFDTVVKEIICMPRDK